MGDFFMFYANVMRLLENGLCVIVLNRQRMQSFMPVLHNNVWPIFIIAGAEASGLNISSGPVV